LRAPGKPVIFRRLSGPRASETPRKDPPADAQAVRISLDAMGGDHGAKVVVPGAALALERHPGLRFLMFGDEAVINPLLAAHPALKGPSRFATRMWRSPWTRSPPRRFAPGAANPPCGRPCRRCATGGGRGRLRRQHRRAHGHVQGLPQDHGPYRAPAIAAMWPTLRGESIVLDVGATIGADAGHLVDMAIMGAAMARIVFDLDRPTVGLLNVGTEEIKGIETVKEAGRILREANLPNLDYRGFVEGDDLGKGTVDVVVTEGFTGNIALKTAEGTAKQIGEYLRAAMGRTTMAKIGYLFAKKAFDALKEKMDPRKVNGGVFLGLEGVVIKSHGGTDALGFASAIDIAYDMAHYELMQTIRTMLEQNPVEDVQA
jgi:glycerol-3-phosphate acyltransferase PlsX